MRMPTNAEIARMEAEHEKEQGLVVRRRFVSRTLAMRMGGYERSEKWLDDKNAERAEREASEGDAAIMGRLLGL